MADDWTMGWTRAAGLALSSWTRDPRALAEPEASRRLEVLLEEVVCRWDLALHAYVILPGALHLVTGRPLVSEPDPRIPWPAALGLVKGSFARWQHARSGGRGSSWRAAVRVRPLAPPALRDAIDALHAAPVSLGLVTEPSAYRFSSWQRLYAVREPSFVTPAPGALGALGALGSRT